MHICAPDRRELLLTELAGGGVHWVHAVGGHDGTVAPFAADGVRALAATYELMTTDSAIDAALEAHGDGLLSHLDCFKVFARMSPQGKARVIRALQERNGRRVFMCGDGGNDVGALKQADVGLALLSGYGDQNTTEDARADGGAAAGAGAPKAEELLNSQTLELARKANEASTILRVAMAAKQKELSAKQQAWLQEAVAARAAAGEPTGLMAHVHLVKESTLRMRKELDEERRRLTLIHGNVFDAQRDAIAKMTAEFSSAATDGGEMMVRPGDASVAAPFTSRAPSVRNIVDLIRQGRCTLLSALQQQQIMMLESLISAYVLSALSLEGARSSERQMVASSWLLMIAGLAFSYATPVERMHPERPLRRLFHPAIFVSMAGQALIHLYCMRTAVNMATGAMGPAKLAEVVEFHRRERLRELKEANQAKAAEEGDWMAASMALWSTPFLPNLLNTCVFLVETSQCVAILLVNYKGRPWMKGITENHPLFLSLFATVVGCAGLSWSVFPQVNEAIHLEPFPDDAFRFKVRARRAARGAGWDARSLVALARLARLSRARFGHAHARLARVALAASPVCACAGDVARADEPGRHLCVGPALHLLVCAKRLRRSRRGGAQRLACMRRAHARARAQCCPRLARSRVGCWRRAARPQLTRSRARALHVSSFSCARSSTCSPRSNRSPRSWA